MTVSTSEKDVLDSLTFYYYSEVEPQTEGNFWHYGENGELLVW